MTPLTPRRTTVLIADDHAIVIKGLVALLKADFDVIGAVADGERLLDAARRLKPDVIVTDLSMPGLSGLDVLGTLQVERIASKVVVLTMHNDGERAQQALKAGASAFVLKESAGEELIAAIRQTLQGRVYLSAAITRSVIARIADHAARPGPSLTSRQLDVLRLIVKGRRMKEIAAALHLSPRTIETHKYEMMQVLGLHSTATLVRYAIEHRLAGD